jgi:hypothetical protein
MQLTSRVKLLAALTLGCAIGELAGFSSASAASASGPSALALAAVVAAHGSQLGSFDKRAMSRLFDGKGGLIISRVRKITVTADSIVCKMSDVDITQRSCDVTFKSHKRTLTGRDANEVFATLALGGVMSEGAAGSINASIKNLECTVEPKVIAKRAGGGATCMFE